MKNVRKKNIPDRKKSNTNKAFESSIRSTNASLERKIKLLKERNDLILEEKNNLITERDHLNHERVNLIHERDDLINERAHLHAERHRFINSTSWKLTKPLRLFTGFLKGHLKPKTFFQKLSNRINKKIDSKREMEQVKVLDAYIKDGGLIGIKKLYNHLNNE